MAHPRRSDGAELHLAYRRFCHLDLAGKVPDRSTFSVNRHGRFRDRPKTAGVGISSCFSVFDPLSIFASSPHNLSPSQVST